MFLDSIEYREVKLLCGGLIVNVLIICCLGLEFVVCFFYEKKLDM
jgi:hypothetical protein